MSAPAVIPKPIMRGYLHAVTAPIALVGALLLLWASRGAPLKFVSLLIYGITLVLLFALSAVYHLGDWPPAMREKLRRFDHSNIYLLIAGTYTPVAITALRGAERIGILVGVWLPALAGIAAVVVGLRLPRWVSAGLYILVGWVAVLFLPALARRYGLPALAVTLLGGLLYSAGAACYALQRPRLWPRVFGYHEVFHLLVIGGSAVFFVFIVRYVVPYSTG